jgi:dTDP-4-amino-4,6-dideoxygalactose transaminase
MAISRRDDVMERMSKQRAFGIDKTVVAERRHSGAYDVELLGLNYRMSELAAALGSVQLQRLPEFLERRRENDRRLRDALTGLDGISVLDPGGGRFEHSWYCLTVLLEGVTVERREEVLAGLKSRGVGASIYYPKPLPLTTYYRNRYRYREGQFPVAERISFGSIALPVAPHVAADDVDRIAEALRVTLAEVARG